MSHSSIPQYLRRFEPLPLKGRMLRMKPSSRSFALWPAFFLKSTVALLPRQRQLGINHALEQVPVVRGHNQRARPPVQCTSPAARVSVSRSSMGSSSISTFGSPTSNRSNCRRRRYPTDRHPQAPTGVHCRSLVNPSCSTSWLADTSFPPTDKTRFSCSISWVTEARSTAYDQGYLGALA